MKCRTTEIKSLINRCRSIIFYCVFGVLTTAVNTGIYYLLFNVLSVTNLVSTAVSWFFAVVFAFITNKIWVFNSKSFERDIFFRELGTFFSCRIVTGLLDLGIMYVAVDRMNLNEILWKLLSNIIVIVLNFITSKAVIFHKTDR